MFQREVNGGGWGHKKLKDKKKSVKLMKNITWKVNRKKNRRLFSCSRSHKKMGSFTYASALLSCIKE